MRTSRKTERIKIDQKERNVTPRVSVDEPVVNNDLKSFWNVIFRFVSVGGDFV